MANIHVLSPHVANLIAAGEVVERPASAAKELLENAIDAGANAITIEIKSGGIEYLRVTDNGCGIAADDVPTAFKRHSTSKIRSEEDLTSIHTLGFRGEALAAIASVSKIDLLTKRACDEMGTSLHLEGGEIKNIDQAGCPDGTTIIVRSLFYNTPARMKFLKRDSAEGGAVESVVQSVALSHPEVSIKFIKEGKQVLHTPGDNDLQSAIYSLFGRDTANGMLNANGRVENTTVTGFVSKPINARGNRMMQYFFVNGRAIKSRLLSIALDEAYKDCLMKGKFPACVLFIEMPFEFVDVNVHPAKTEVKFAREREVFDAVYCAAKTGLSQDDGKTPAQLEKSVRTVEPEVQKVEIKPNVTEFKGLNVKPVAYVSAPEDVGITFSDNAKPIAFKPEIKPTFKPEVEEYTEKDQTVILEAVEKKENDIKPKHAEEKEIYAINDKPSSEYRILGEIFDTYIIIEQGESMLLIDKHAAHERIIFNSLKKTDTSPQAQMLISSVVVSLSVLEIEALNEYKSELRGIGFDFDEFGQDSIAVRQVPDGISEGDVATVIQEIAQELLDGRKPTTLEKLDAVRHSVACKAAIKAGRKSDFAEIKKIADTVINDEEIRYCPHGRPVTVEMTKYQLEKQFKRVL